MNQDIQRPVKVFIELFRPSDESRSDPREFRYIPNRDKPGGKKRRYDYSSSYNSSDYASDELPSTINNIKTEQDHNLIQMNAPINSSLSLPIPDNLSEELQKAMLDYDSVAFKNLFNKHCVEFQELIAIDNVAMPQGPK